jgi:hypothetical protein
VRSGPTPTLSVMKWKVNTLEDVSAICVLGARGSLSPRAFSSALSAFNEFISAGERGTLSPRRGNLFSPPPPTKRSSEKSFTLLYVFSAVSRKRLFVRDETRAKRTSSVYFVALTFAPAAICFY